MMVMLSRSAARAIINRFGALVEGDPRCLSM
jgi:hypothetical protein